MSEGRQPPRHCAGCQQTTTRPVLIRIHDQGSGPGGSTYGCRACIAAGRLTIAPDLLDLAPAELREVAR